MPTFADATKRNDDSAKCGKKWKPRDVGGQKDCRDSQSQGEVMTFVDENKKRQWCTAIFSADQTMEPGKTYKNPTDDSWSETTDLSGVTTRNRDVVY